MIYNFCCWARAPSCPPSSLENSIEDVDDFFAKNAALFCICAAPLELFLRSTLVELWLGLAALGRDALADEDAPRIGAVAAAAARLKRRKCCV